LKEIKDYEKELKSNKERFSKQIEKYVQQTGCKYIEAVLAFCEHHDIEPESAAKLLTQPIKERLEMDGQEMNILPKKNSIL
jgi:uncharacterized protein YjgD (DUF1641 family)